MKLFTSIKIGKYEIQENKKAIASDAVLGDRAEVIELFRWLLGYDDFPIRMDGEGLYYWRKELRQKLKDIGIVIK